MHDDDNEEVPEQSYWAMLKRAPDYTKLWLAACISNAGDWFTLPLLAGMIESIAGEAGFGGFAITLLLISRTIPPMLSSTLGGVLLDRYDRRTVLFVSSGLRALLTPLYLLAWADVSVPARLAVVYVLTCLQYVCSGVYEPGESALIPSLVQPYDTVLANTFMSVSWSFVAAMGAMLGGYCSSALGRYASIGIDTASFVVGTLLVYLIRVPEPSSPSSSTAAPSDDLPVEKALLQRDDDDDDDEYNDAESRPSDVDVGAAPQQEVTFWNGFRYALARPVILVASLGKFCLVALDFSTITIVLSAQLYPIGENGTISQGIIWSCFGVGAIVGPWLSSKLSDGTTPVLLRINGMVTSLGIAGAWLLLWLAVSLDSVFGVHSTAYTIALLGLASFVRGSYSCTLWTNCQVLLQISTRNDYLGRIFSIDWILLNIGQVYSTTLQGTFIDVFGLERTNLLIAASLAVGLVLNVPWIVANFWLSAKQAASSSSMATSNAK